ncbi:hypothetical protein L4D08_08435 [Photobacterium chitinilyticum]|uniref:hypothetical protein n=1 Tax=Photobacterium chitinilyticum TaxID=2485123 RepID=UPI003D10C66F
MNFLTQALNKKEVMTLFKSQPKEITLPSFVLPSGYKLMVSEIIDNEKAIVQNYCLLWGTDEQAEIVYKIKSIISDRPIKACTQLTICRQLAGPHSHVYSIFIRSMLDFLLQSYNIIITEKQQTQEVQRFWLDRIGESIMMKNRKVYYLDLNKLNNEKTLATDHISSHESLMAIYYPKYWGKDEPHTNCLFVISNQELSL